MGDKDKKNDMIQSSEVEDMSTKSQKRQSTRKWTRVISERGQTVVPKDVRNHLDVKGGDSLEWVVNEDGDVVVKPKKRKSVMDLKGAVKAKQPIDDMDKVIQESKEKHIRRKMKEGRL